jgi:hypothetical protein
MPHQHTQKKEQQQRSRLVFPEAGRDPWKTGGGGIDPIRSERGRSLRSGGAPPARCDVAIGCLAELGTFISASVVRRRYVCQYRSA